MYVTWQTLTNKLLGGFKGIEPQLDASFRVFSHKVQQVSRDLSRTETKVDGQGEVERING